MVTASWPRTPDESRPTPLKMLLLVLVLAAVLSFGWIFSVSPLVHGLALAQMAWFYETASRADERGAHRRTIRNLLWVSGGWIALTTWLAADGFYYRYNARFMPVVIVSLLAVTLLVLATRGFSAVCALVNRMIERVSFGRLAIVQVLRVGALGAIYKAATGQLPVHMGIGTGIPDFLFGLSAIYVARNAERLSSRFHLAWNVVGIAIFFAALVAMQLTVPGPFHFITDGPTAREVFSFPMSLAPTFLAPCFIGINLLGIEKLRRKGGGSQR